MARTRILLLNIFQRLLDQYGPQSWWPADNPFEIIVGAILTQGTKWANVEKALSNLKSANSLSPVAIRTIPLAELSCLVYPSGYFNEKARKLKAIAEFIKRYDDDIDTMAAADGELLRKELLSVYGIGEETADDILVYAIGKPYFVIDEYTKRIFHRIGLASEQNKYSQYQALFADNLSETPEIFGEYHALIVAHAINVCKKQEPRCWECCVLDLCDAGKEVTPPLK